MAEEKIFPMGCGWCKCFGIPWRSLPNDFSRFYTYVCGYVHSVFGFYILFTGIFLQAFLKIGFANPYSLFTPPQFFALLTNCAQEKDYAVWNGRESKKKDAGWRQKEARIILFKFNAVAERRQWSSAASIPRRKSLAKLFPHFCAANVPSLQICRLRSALWYSGVSNSSISARISFQK